MNDIRCSYCGESGRMAVVQSDSAVTIAGRVITGNLCVACDKRLRSDEVLALAEVAEVVMAALRRGARFVEVPGRLVPPDGHRQRWAWIPRLDGRPPPCGAFERIENRDAELWCLLPEDHPETHGYAYHASLDALKDARIVIWFCPDRDDAAHRSHDGPTVGWSDSPMIPRCLVCGATGDPRPKSARACSKCGHDPACGLASVTVDQVTTWLCHDDDHSCYSGSWPAGL